VTTPSVSGAVMRSLEAPRRESLPPNKRMQQSARLGFKRKVTVVMSWGALSNGQHRLARWLITPQLMRRAVRRRHRRRGGWRG
jgi:hypothetical protein